MQKKKHSAETCDVADWPNFRLFNKKMWETWKTTFFQNYFKKCLYFGYVYIFEHSIHFLRIFFCKTYLGNELHLKNFCYNISLLNISLYMIVNIFCLSGWEIFAGVCNTDAREKFIWTWCRPEHPKFMFSSYFVSPGRLLLEG